MSKILFEDRLKGGVDVANLDKYLNRFDPKEVKIGVKDEKEHTNDPKIAAEIASDHLATEPHYYSKLKKAHIESIDVFEFNFFDILESDDDVPLGLLIHKKLDTKEISNLVPKKEPKKVKTVEPKKIDEPEKTKSLSGWADRRLSLQTGLEKMGAQSDSVKASLDIYDKNNPIIARQIGGRPRTRDQRKNNIAIPEVPAWSVGRPEVEKKPKVLIGRTQRQKVYRDVGK